MIFQGKTGLGMSVSDRKELVENVNVVINCAAVTDFRLRLDLILNINVIGTLRLFELAKTFKHLESFVHCSTGYVNSYRGAGFISEKIYYKASMDDPEQLLKTLLSYTPEQIKKNEKQLLGTFPNTYTYTKHLCERLMMLRRGNTSVTICRPTIIGCSWIEPQKGFTDSLAATGLYLIALGYGLMRWEYCIKSTICDQVPVDFVSN